MNAPSRGSNGMNAMWSRKFITPAASIKVLRSPLQKINLIRVHRLFVAEEGDDQAQAHGGFGGGVGNHEDGEHLTVHVMKHLRKSHQVDVHRVQDQFDGHENNDHVAAGEHADHADGKKSGAEIEIPTDGNHSNFLLAITTAPTIATSRRSEAISTGNVYVWKSPTAMACVLVTGAGAGKITGCDALNSARPR